MEAQQLASVIQPTGQMAQHRWILATKDITLMAQAQLELETLAITLMEHHQQE